MLKENHISNLAQILEHAVDDFLLQVPYPSDQISNLAQIFRHAVDVFFLQVIEAFVLFCFLEK